jgi:hypothetical protein
MDMLFLEKWDSVEGCGYRAVSPFRYLAQPGLRAISFLLNRVVLLLWKSTAKQR